MSAEMARCSSCPGMDALLWLLLVGLAARCALPALAALRARTVFAHSEIRGAGGKTVRHTLDIGAVALYDLGVLRVARVPHDTDRRTWTTYVGALGHWWHLAFLDTTEPYSAPSVALALVEDRPRRPRPSLAQLQEERDALRAQKKSDDHARYALRRDLRALDDATLAAEHALCAARTRAKEARDAHACAHARLEERRTALLEAQERVYAVTGAAAQRASIASESHARYTSTARAMAGRAREVREEIAALQRTAAALQSRPPSPPAWDVANLLPSSLLSTHDEENAEPVPHKPTGLGIDPTPSVPPLCHSPLSAVSCTPPTPHGAVEGSDYLHAGFRPRRLNPNAKTFVAARLGARASLGDVS